MSTAVVSLRLLQPADLPVVLAWRNHPSIRQLMHTTREIGLAEHSAWYAQARLDPARTLLVLEVDNQASGYISFFQHASENSAVWGFYTSPDAPSGTGRLLAEAALKYGFETLGLSTITAEVVTDNARSQRFHEQNGFRRDEAHSMSQLQSARHRAVHHYVLARSGWQANRGQIHD